MPLFTPKYKLGYFLGNDIYAAEIERNRWISVDEHLSALFSLIGNGVLYGFQITGDIDVSSQVVLTPGVSIISGIVVKNNQNKAYPLGSLGAGSYKVIATLTESTLRDQSFSINFISSSTSTPPSAIELAEISVTQGGKLGGLVDKRTFLGITDQVVEAVSNHVHNGQGSNPSKINLSEHVTGILPVSHLPDIPYSKLTGSIPSSIVKNFSHFHLKDTGALSHIQLDEFVSGLRTSGYEHMGSITASNILLYLLWSIKNSNNANVLRYLINTRAIVPGITPESWYDAARSDALYDTTNKRIESNSTATEIDPPIIVTKTINKASGEDGFTGPSVSGMQNLTVTDVGEGNVEVTLLKTAVLYYYKRAGSLYLEFNAGTVVKWDIFSYSHQVIGSSSAIGENGFSIKIYARSALSREGLSRAEFTLLREDDIGSVSLGQIPASRWIQIKIELNSGDPQANILIKEGKISYSLGSSKLCAFLIYPHLDDWNEDLRDISNTVIDGYKKEVRLGVFKEYKAQCTYISRVISAPVISSDKFVHWGYLKLTYKKPQGSNIKVFVRTSPTRFNPDAPSSGANSIPWVEQNLSDLIFLSKRHPSDANYRQPLTNPFIQLKLVIDRAVYPNGVQLTPEILSASISFYIAVTNNFISLEEGYHMKVNVENPEGNFSTRVYDNNNNEYGLFNVNYISPHFPYALVVGGNHSFSEYPFYPDYIYDGLIRGKFPQGLVDQGNYTINYHESINKGFRILHRYYKIWGSSNNSENGWSAPQSRMVNMRYDEYTGGLTVIDKSRPAQWVSPKYYVSEEIFEGWDSLEITGFNLRSVLVKVQFNNTEAEQNWIDAATLRPGPDTGDYKISGALRDLINYRKYKYIRFIIDVSP